MDGDCWSVSEAKAQFSKLIEQAQTQGPQIITRRGRKTVILVSAEEWEARTKRKGTLAEFFAASPLRNSGIEIERLKERPGKPVL